MAGNYLKRILSISFFFFLFFTGFFLLPAAEPDVLVTNERVAVLPLWYSNDLDFGKNLSDTVQTSTQFFLRFLPSYQLIESTDYPSGQSGFNAFIEENEIDSVIYGRVSESAGQYDISLLYYNSEQDQVVAIKQGSSNSLMDIFDLADELSLAILESFLGRPIAIGSLVFESEDVDHYRVSINGEVAGEDLRSIPRMITGEYSFIVEQILDDGRYVVVKEGLYSVEANQETRIAFSQVDFVDVLVQSEGPDEPFTLTDERSGLIFRDISAGSRLALPEGSYRWQVTQKDYRGNPFPVDTVPVEITRTDNPVMTIPVIKVGRGFRFIPKSDAEYEIRIDGEILEGDFIDVLPVGDYEVEIFQILDGEGLPVIERRYRNRLDEITEIAFPLFPDKKSWSYYRKNFKPDLSLEIVAGDGSFAQGGVRWEGLHRRVGISALGGFYLYNEKAVPLAKLKLQWLPLGGGSRISPEIGTFVMSELREDAMKISTGAQLGIAWNTGHPVFSSLFWENELRYASSELFLLTWYTAIGCRLF